MATALKLNVIGEIAEKAGESRKEAIKAQSPGLLKRELVARPALSSEQPVRKDHKCESGSMR